MKGYEDIQLQQIVNPKFVTTEWSLLSKVKSTDETVVQNSLEKLCQQYWFPLFVWLKNKGYSTEDSEDLIQGFFQYAIESNLFLKADSSKGRLRSFLLKSLENYTKDERKISTAQKRGGSHKIVSLEHIAERGGTEIQDNYSDSSINPELAYEKSWGQVLIKNSMERLEKEYVAKDKLKVFESLSPLLIENKQDYQLLASQLEMKEGAVRVALHRLSKRFSEIVREEVAATLLPGDLIEEEMEYLARLLS